MRVEMNKAKRRLEPSRKNMKPVAYTGKKDVGSNLYSLYREEGCRIQLIQLIQGRCRIQLIQLIQGRRM